jgi:hypothetical protein
MTELPTITSSSEDSTQAHKSDIKNQSTKEILMQKINDYNTYKKQNDDLVEKLSILLTEIVTKKQGYFMIFTLEFEDASKKKKDLETENYVLIY